MLSKSEINKIKKLLEEFSWLMGEYSSLDLKKASLYIESNNSETKKLGDAIGYKPKNPNRHFLTGALPSLFLDPQLFKTNDEIAQFSEEVIGVKISRYEKRSKYEIIGIIVCEANSLDDKGLYKIVNALEKLVSDEKNKDLVKNNKESSSYFNWNEVIQKLNES